MSIDSSRAPVALASYDNSPDSLGRALELCEAFSDFSSHHHVMIKPNLVAWDEEFPIAPFGVYTTTRLVDIEVEDTGVAVLQFASGALGIIEATTATRPKDLEGSISILGERGSVEIGGFAVNEIKIWNFVDEDKRDEEIRTRYNQNPPDVYGFGHRLFLENVVHSIQTNTSGLVHGLEGRKSLELINAIYESVETGREVRLKFRARKCRLGR